MFGPGARTRDIHIRPDKPAYKAHCQVELHLIASPHVVLKLPRMPHKAQWQVELHLVPSPHVVLKLPHELKEKAS